MYAYPTLIPQVSNREDLLLSLSLFDDDTGDAIDFSGMTLARAGDFTHNVWLVKSGPWVTTSQSVLTIPDYPIGSQLTAVSLIVDAGLGIVAGDPLTISDLPGGVTIIGPVGPPPTPLMGEDGTTFLVTEDSSSFSTGPSSLIGGPNTMTGYVTSYDPVSGNLVCQIGCTFQCEIRHVKRSHDVGGGFPSQWDSYDDTCGYGTIITASLGNGLTLVDVGVLQLRIPESTFRQLRHRTYSVALTVTDSYDTRQLFVGRLPVQFGGVNL